MRKRVSNLTLFIVLFYILILSGCAQNEKQAVTTNKITDNSKAVLLAKEIYAQEKAKGTDFSNGPCIANPIEQMPDWVVDIAHSPRQAVDNLPENQCSAFSQRKASHFVELDESGNLINSY